MAIPVRLDRSVPDGDKHAKAPGGLVILVVDPSTRSLLLSVAGFARPATRQVRDG